MILRSLIIAAVVNLTLAANKLPPQDKKVAVEGGSVEKAATSKPPVVDLDNVEPEHKANVVELTTAKATTAGSVETGHLLPGVGPDERIQSGALLRGFFVVLGITGILLVYLGFRMFRLNKGGGRPPPMVRKYGVLTNRTDVEMLPLPLSEDEDDDTVFEVGQHHRASTSNER